MADETVVSSAPAAVETEAATGPKKGAARRRRPRAAEAAGDLVLGLTLMRRALHEIREDVDDPDKVLATAHLAAELLALGATIPHDLHGHSLRQLLEVPTTNAAPDPDLNLATANLVRVLVSCLEEGRKKPRERAYVLESIAINWPRFRTFLELRRGEQENEREETLARHHAQVAALEAGRGSRTAPVAASVPDGEAPPLDVDEPDDLTVG